MAIVYYNTHYMHGLRVYVKKVGCKPIQKVFSFKGKTKAEIKALRKEAAEFEAAAAEDRELRKVTAYLTKPSCNPLSDVYGISVHVTHRPRASGTVPILSIMVAGRLNGKATTVKRFEKVCSDSIDYEWFKASWAKACKIRSLELGLQRTPTRWLQAVPSKRAVNKIVFGNHED